MSNPLVDYFIGRAIDAIQGADPRVLSIIARHYLERALAEEPPAHFLFEYSHVNEARVIYYKALALAFERTETQTQSISKEGAWAILSFSRVTKSKTQRKTSHTN